MYFSNINRYASITCCLLCGCRRSRRVFRNTLFSRNSTHPPRTSRVRLNPRISVGGPFGEVIKITGTASGQPFGFSTKYRDDETGMVYYGYRYLVNGRWLTRDPIEERGGLNLYCYVSSAPTKFIDAYGLKRKCDVETFVVTWEKDPELGGTNAIFKIKITIKFKNDADHDPSCCEFRQNVATKFHIKQAAGGPVISSGNPVMHRDNYSRADNKDGSKDLSNPSFVTDDFPGFGNIPPPNPVNPNDDIDFEFTAEQIVYSLGDACCCEKNDQVAKKGPHTGTIKGKYPRIFTGVPATL